MLDAAKQMSSITAAAASVSLDSGPPSTTKGRKWKGSNPPGYVSPLVSGPPTFCLSLPTHEPNITSDCVGNLFYFNTMNTTGPHNADRTGLLLGGWTRVKNTDILQYRCGATALSCVQFNNLCQSCLPIIHRPIATAETQHFHELNDANSTVQSVLKHSMPSMNHYVVPQQVQVMALATIVTRAKMTADTWSLIEYLVEHGISTMYQKRIGGRNVEASELISYHLIDAPHVQAWMQSLRANKPKENAIGTKIIVLFSQKKRDLAGDDGCG